MKEIKILSPLRAPVQDIKGTTQVRYFGVLSDSLQAPLLQPLTPPYADALTRLNERMEAKHFIIIFLIDFFITVRKHLIVFCIPS